MSLMQANAHVRKRSERQRAEHDFYRTPTAATAALLKVEQFSAEVWEPACGDGALGKVLFDHGYVVVATDLFDRGYGAPGYDFLTQKSLLAPCIITNPPFGLADEFALHALELGAKKVALFHRSAWLEGARRHKTLWGPHPPARVWQFSKRQTLWRGDDPEPRSTGGAIPFSWYVWESQHSGPPALGWV